MEDGLEVAQGQLERVGEQVRPAAVAVDLGRVVGVQGQGLGVVVDGAGEVVAAGPRQAAEPVQLGGGRAPGQRGVARVDHVVVALHLEQGGDPHEVGDGRVGGDRQRGVGGRRGRPGGRASRSSSRPRRTWSSAAPRLPGGSRRADSSRSCSAASDLGRRQVVAVEPGQRPAAVQRRHLRLERDRLAQPLDRLVAAAELAEGLRQRRVGVVAPRFERDRPLEVGGGGGPSSPLEPHDAAVHQQHVIEDSASSPRSSALRKSASASSNRASDSAARAAACGDDRAAAASATPIWP